MLLEINYHAEITHNGTWTPITKCSNHICSTTAHQRISPHVNEGHVTSIWQQ